MSANRSRRARITRRRAIVRTPQSGGCPRQVGKSRRPGERPARGPVRGDRERRGGPRESERQKLVRLMKLAESAVVRYPPDSPPADPAAEQSVGHLTSLLGRAGEEV